MKDTKEKILETAVALMIKHGYNGVSIADITNALGLARSLPYRYFKSKSDLFFEAFKQYFCDRFISAEADYSKISLKECTDIILGNLREIIATLSRISKREIHIFDYNALYFEALKREPRFRSYIKRTLFAFNPVIERAAKNGEIKSGIPCDVLSRMLFDIMSRCADIEKDSSPADAIDTISRDIYAFYDIIALKSAARGKKKFLTSNPDSLILATI